MITFKVQYEKLVKAYLRNEVVPDSACACFIGNLLNGDSSWILFKEAIEYQIPKEDLNIAVNALKLESNDTYTPKEILYIEGAFMRVWRRYGRNEDALFKAFEHALMLLRQIHESKGEVIEDYRFKKRQLIAVS
jgi:hypothetical protein